MNGVLNIYKDQNMTSHDVVAIVRRVLKTKKVGHTGTLDPMATGVLPICIGQATKIVDFLQADKKTYIAELTLGVTTDTEDAWGEVLETKEVHVTDDEISKAILSFVGEIEQVPPMYSALKVKGKKLYELAREGKVIERQARIRHIYQIEILSIADNKVKFEVVCSKGTYIRTLCKDIGEVLGVGGHMSSLDRSATGNFHKEQSISIEDLKAESFDQSAHLIPIDLALTFDKKIEISDKAKELVMNGVKIDLAHYFKSELKAEDYVMVYNQQEFFALAQFNHDRLQVVKRFDTQRSS
ncbi:MAG: tRNA pseudouridine(55) synthase TruB [Clostridia bacterium]|nr:tRNA pseudouridine(55) synthase TruB [Clostridia bacterium]